jgi:hypothetical protein
VLDRHDGRPPKRLEDLRKIDANVRIVCATCKHARLCDRELLLAGLHRRRKTTEWRVLHRLFRCRARGCRFAPRAPVTVYEAFKADIIADDPYAAFQQEE